MCEDGKTVYDLAVERRTIRRFKAADVPREVLEKIVNAGRLAPSAANMQPLEFVLVDDEKTRAAIFPLLKWAAYITPAGNPPPGHEPRAYVVVVVNTKVREKMYEYDVGAAVENMILTALCEGVGSCWMLSVERNPLRTLLGVPEEYLIDCVLALGYPDEAPAVEVMGDSCRYWKDAEGRLHVPKRAMASVLHLNRY